jgi:tyrosinase
MPASFALDGAQYSLHFFLGNVADEDISTRTSMISAHPRHVGSMYTFSSAEVTRHCSNCKKQTEEGILSTAQLPLTVHLLNQAADANIPDIHHIDHHSVERYLEKHLTWKAIAVSTAGHRLILIGYF